MDRRSVPSAATNSTPTRLKPVATSQSVGRSRRITKPSAGKVTAASSAPAAKGEPKFVTATSASVPSATSQPRRRSG